MTGGRLERHIALVGYMAVGKTTVGAILAERLKVKMVDTDKLIEQKEGMSVSRIFEELGEQHFRALEQATIKEVLTFDPCIIATGGGLPSTHDNMKQIVDVADSVWLMLGINKIVDRLLKGTGRPLTDGLDRKGLKKITKAKLMVRRQYYQMADVHVRAWSTPEQVAGRILKKLNK